MRTIPIWILPAALLAQAPTAAPHATVAGHLATATVIDATAADGLIFAAGPDWKAEVGVGGLTFRPFLGSGAERQWPVTFTLNHVRLGAEDLPLADAVPALADRRIELRRGACTERYDVRAGGIEQSFAFTDLPSRGELVLGVDFATDLDPEVTAEGIRFHGPLGGVRYGAATAIDGDGDALALTTTLVGNRLQITVPAAFVARATLPLVIDPLVGTVHALQASATQILGRSDIAYDASLHRHLVVVERAFSAADMDCYGAVLDDDLNVLTALAFDVTATSWTGPRVANLAAHDSFVMTAARAGTPSQAVVRAWQPLAAVSPVQVVGSIGANGQPDIGGNPTDDMPQYATVVFGVSAKIWRRQFNYDGTPHDNPYDISGTSFPAENESPHISKSCGSGPAASRGWAVVWVYRNGSFDVGRVRGAILDPSGSVATPATQILGDAIIHASRPLAVSSPSDAFAFGRRFLLTFERLPAATGLDVNGVLFDRNLQVMMPYTSLVALATQDGAYRDRDQQNAAVDCDGVRFAVAWEHRLTQGQPATRVHVTAFGLNVNGTGLIAQDVLQNASGATQDPAHARPALVAWRSGGGERLRYGMCWTRTLTGTATELAGSIYDGGGIGGISQRATGCGGLPIQAHGLPGLGNTLTFDLIGTTGLAGFVLGAPVTTPLAFCPGCTQGASGTSVLGSTATVAIPANLVFRGTTIALQGFDFAQGPCLGQIRLSDTVEVIVQ